jgi:prepilin-type processing-associated H-X9-DG protein
MNNLRQLLTAFQMYADDHDGYLVHPHPVGTDEGYMPKQSAYYVSAYWRYAPDRRIWHCPSQPFPERPEDGRYLSILVHDTYYSTYQYEGLERMEVSSIQDSGYLSDMVIMDSVLPLEAGGPGGDPGLPHGGPADNSARSFGNVGFVDGSVRCMTGRQIKQHRIELAESVGQKPPD